MALYEGNPVTRGFPSQKGPVMRKPFPFHDVSVTSITLATSWKLGHPIQAVAWGKHTSIQCAFISMENAYATTKLYESNLLSEYYITHMIVVNSSRSRDAYMRQWNRPSLVQMSVATPLPNLTHQHQPKSPYPM